VLDHGGIGGVNPCHQAVEFGIGHDQPFETQVVGRDLHGAGLVVEVEQRDDFVIGRDRRLATPGLEAESGVARRDEVQFALERERGRRQREEAVEFRRHLLGATEESVAKAH